VAAVGGDLVRSAEWRQVRAFAKTARTAPAALAVQGGRRGQVHVVARRYRDCHGRRPPCRPWPRHSPWPWHSPWPPNPGMDHILITGSPGRYETCHRGRWWRRRVGAPWRRAWRERRWRRRGRCTRTV